MQNSQLSSLTFEITPGFLHVGHDGLHDDFKIFVGFALQRDAIPYAGDDRRQLKFLFQLVGFWLLMHDDRCRADSGDGRHRARLFGGIDREQPVQVGDEVLAVYFPLLPNVEYPRDFLLDFVIAHQRRRLLQRRPPAIDELVISPLAVLDNIVGEIEQRQATLDFH